MPAASFDTLARSAISLKDKTVLITGGGRGIGRAIALKCGEAGANVALTYTGSSEKSEANAREVCEAIQKMGAQALALPMDLTQEEQIEKCVKAVVEKFGGLQGLVNNAGVAIDQLTARYKIEDWDKLMDTNLRGAFLVTKAAMRPLMKAGSASVVMVSSVVGQMGNAGQAPYSASKAGLIGMAKSLARELASRNVRVNAIAPGFIKTDMTAALNEAQAQALSAQIPLNRLGEADDVANAALFLLSELSSYVTGQVLSINGGLYM